MQLFVQNLTTQKSKIEADFGNWRDAISSRDIRQAKRSAEQAKKRLNALEKFLSANADFVRALDTHFLALNDFARQDFGLKDFDLIVSALSNLQGKLSSMQAGIHNTFNMLNIQDAKDIANSDYIFRQVNPTFVSACTYFSGVEELVTQEILTLSKDLREVVKKRRADRQATDIIKLLVAAEREMNKLR